MTEKNPVVYFSVFSLHELLKFIYFAHARRLSFKAGTLKTGWEFELEIPPYITSDPDEIRKQVLEDE